MSGTQSEWIESLSLELRRGVVVLAALSQLREEQYGYSLKKSLAERGMPIDEGTLYPLLRRLESQELLQSDWRVDGSRPRKYYSLTARGRQALDELSAEWNRLALVMGDLLS
ncbi:MAG: PadR family transcriptional regulator [Acidobacteriota bacterium]